MTGRIAAVVFALALLLFVAPASAGTTAFLGLTVDQGADYATTFVWTTGDIPNGVTPTAVDLTGASCVFSIRASQSPTSAALFTSSPALGGTAGSISLSVTAAQTLSLPAGQYFYDIFITFPSGQITKFLAGTLVYR